MSNIAIVPFQGSDLITIKVNEIIYVAMRPIVEALGLNWSTQARKLKKSHIKHGCSHMTTPTKNGIQEMLFIPLRKLNGWLFSINPEKVREDLREKVIRYQEECFEVLFCHFMPRFKKEEIITADQAKQIQRAVMDLYRKTGEHYQHIYGRFSRHFDIPRYRELLAKDFDNAMEYLELTHQQKQLQDPNVVHIPFPLHRDARYEVMVYNGQVKRWSVTKCEMLVDRGKLWACNKQ